MTSDLAAERRAMRDRAIIQARLLGQTRSSVAKEHDLSPSSVARIMRKFERRQHFYASKGLEFPTYLWAVPPVGRVSKQKPSRSEKLLLRKDRLGARLSTVLRAVRSGGPTRQLRSVETQISRAITKLDEQIAQARLAETNDIIALGVRVP